MPSQAAPEPRLRRELGRWDLTAIGVNQVIGSAIFAQPALLAASIGAWSPWAVAAIGVASMLIALSFAEVGSRFEGTGGPYLYTRAAFGRFAAFEVGWLAWVTRAVSWAAVTNVLVAYLGFYWAALTSGAPRLAVLTTVIAAIAYINVRGIRQSSVVVNILTIGKLVPLVVFVAVGLFFVDGSRLAPGDVPPVSALSASALVLIFGFGGYEVIPVPAGEATDPRRGVPFALVMTIAIVTVLMLLVQVVAVGTLPDLAASSTPLADASLLFLGAAGAVLMTAGAVVSTTGNNMGQALSAPRNLFALAEHGDLPAFFGRVHPRFRTPANAIVVTAAVVLVLAATGSFEWLALMSAVSRIVVYLFTCASTLRLRQPRFAAVVAPARFVAPFGPIIPLAAIAIALAVLVSARTDQLAGGAVAVAAGALLYLAAAARGGREESKP